MRHHPRKTRKGPLLLDAHTARPPSSDTSNQTKHLWEHSRRKTHHTRAHPYGMMTGGLKRPHHHHPCGQTVVADGNAQTSHPPWAQRQCQATSPPTHHPKTHPLQSPPHPQPTEAAVATCPPPETHEAVDTRTRRTRASPRGTSPRNTSAILATSTPARTRAATTTQTPRGVDPACTKTNSRPRNPNSRTRSTGLMVPRTRTRLFASMSRSTLTARIVGIWTPAWLRTPGDGVIVVGMSRGRFPFRFRLRVMVLVSVRDGLARRSICRGQCRMSMGGGFMIGDHNSWSFWPDKALQHHGRPVKLTQAYIRVNHELR